MRARRQAAARAKRAHSGPARVPEPAATMLRLQRSHGNRVVTRLLQRQPKPDDLIKQLGEHLAKGRREVAIDALRKLTKDELAVVDAARGGLGKDTAALLHRCISFVKWGAADEKPHPRDVTVKKEGTAQGLKPTEVPGGKVEVRTDVQYYWNAGSEHKTGAVSLRYTGSHAERTRWLQFIWRGIWVERKPLTRGGKPRTKAVSGTITRGGGSYNLTADRAKPEWNTDASAGTPYFEVNGSVNRSDTEFTLFDPPDHRNDKAKPEWDDDSDPPVKGISVAHLTDYLVRDMDVLLRVDLELEWDLSPPAAKGELPPASAPRFAKPVIKKVAALDPAHRRRVIAQYPGLELEWLP